MMDAFNWDIISFDFHSIELMLAIGISNGVRCMDFWMHLGTDVRWFHFLGWIKCRLPPQYVSVIAVGVGIPLENYWRLSAIQGLRMPNFSCYSSNISMPFARDTTKPSCKP